MRRLTRRLPRRARSKVQGFEDVTEHGWEMGVQPRFTFDV